MKRGFIGKITIGALALSLGAGVLFNSFSSNANTFTNVENTVMEYGVNEEISSLNMEQNAVNKSSADRVFVRKKNGKTKVSKLKAVANKEERYKKLKIPKIKISGKSKNNAVGVACNVEPIVNMNDKVVKAQTAFEIKVNNVVERPSFEYTVVVYNAKGEKIFNKTIQSLKKSSYCKETIEIDDESEYGQYKVYVYSKNKSVIDFELKVVDRSVINSRSDITIPVIR